MFFLLFFREQPIKLEEGEVELHRAKRHWMVLVQRVLIPGMVFLLTLGIIFFRLAGGRLFETSGEAGRFDTISILILGVLAVLPLFYLRSLRVNKKNRASRRNIVFFGLVLLAFLFYHLSGGRLVVFSGSSSGMDGINTFLLIIALVMGLITDFTIYDWRSDDLILTNMRVVYEDYIPLIRDFRLQTQIENVQSVTAKTESYIQNLLGYGTVIVQSAGQTAIVFAGSDDFAAITDPVTGYRKRVSTMQRKLQEQVDKVRKERNPNEYGPIIDRQIFGNAAPPQPPPISVPPGRKGNWVFPQNPEIRQDRDQTIIWRKHRIFELLMLLPALPISILMVVGVVILYENELIGALGVILLTLILFVAVGAYTWYQIEDHRNDLYILTTNSIIDVEKKPLGPENRRTAGLGQIQNVNYRTSWIGNMLGYIGLGYGDVFVETASNLGRFTFHQVPNPREVSTTINDYLNSFRQGERERNMRESLQLLKAYHDAQNKPPQQSPR